jgi:hypothetical protein
LALEVLLSRAKGARSTSVLVLLVLAIAAVAVVPLTLTYGQAQSQLTVTSRDTNGNTITGFATTIYDSSASVVGKRPTPAVFTLNNGQPYTVHVANSVRCLFDHWADTGSPNASRSITMSNATQISAVYNCGATAGASTVTIDSVDQNGSAISGYYVVLYGANGSVMATGLTPKTFATTVGGTYSVQVQQYGSCAFSKWSDGVADDSMIFNMTSASLDLTAVYDCGSAPLPTAGLVQLSESTCSYVCGTGSTATAFPSNVRSGDMLAITVVSDDLTTLNVSDSLGTFMQLGVKSTSTSCESNTGTCQADIYWGMLPASGYDSVTVREGGSDRALRVQAWEFSGVDGVAGGCSPVTYPAGSVLLATGMWAHGAGTGFTWEIYAASGAAGSEYLVSRSPGTTAFPFSTGVNSVEAAAVLLHSPSGIECGAGVGVSTTTTTTTVNASAVMSIRTDRPAYTSGESMVVSGSVSPPPGAPSNVTITITGPQGVVVVATSAVSTTNGSYSYRLVTGGAGGWVTGTYSIRGVWTASGRTETATTSFEFALPAA